MRVRFQPWLPCALAGALVLLAGACSNKESSSASANLTVGGYCSAFCGKLCGTCGDAACSSSCTQRCYHSRDPGMVMDGHDPKIALARTQKDLDGCLATITATSCPSLMSGKSVPPACFTIQH